MLLYTHCSNYTLVTMSDIKKHYIKRIRKVGRAVIAEDIKLLKELAKH